MKVKETYLVLTGLFASLGTFYLTGLSGTECFIIGYQLYLLLRFINNIGNTICYFDYLTFYSALDTLVMPMIGYHLYNGANRLAFIWGATMRVDEQTYYSFVIPANLALFFGVNLLVRKFKPAFYQHAIKRLSEYGKDKGKIGLVLTIIGFVFSAITNVPAGISYVFYLLSMFKYIGPIYIYFSDSPFRKRALLISMLLFLAFAVSAGMFGDFVMYLVLLIIIISLRFKLRFLPKLAAFLVGIFLIFVLQNVKSTYRQISWLGQEQQGLSLQTNSKFEIFTILFYQNAVNMKVGLSKETFFPFYVRMNQGILISKAMNYVPRIEPFANGSTLIRAAGGILLPRFIWPDKPESGGHENLARFTGLKHKISYSMNIGPYGEAYGNFGPVAGVSFIFFYGLLLSFIMRTLLIKSIKHPTILVWLPILFFYTLTVETDVLSTLNSFFKAAIFIAFVFWFSKNFFKVSM